MKGKEMDYLPPFMRLPGLSTPPGDVARARRDCQCVTKAMTVKAASLRLLDSRRRSSSSGRPVDCRRPISRKALY